MKVKIYFPSKMRAAKGGHHFLLRAFFTVSNRLLFIFQPRYEFSAYF